MDHIMKFKRCLRAQSVEGDRNCPDVFYIFLENLLGCHFKGKLTFDGRNTDDALMFFWLNVKREKTFYESKPTYPIHQLWNLKEKNKQRSWMKNVDTKQDA